MEEQEEEDVRVPEGLRNAANLTYPEFSELTTQTLPVASEQELKRMREEACRKTRTSQFRLQPYQRFLRRVLSPDSPTKSLLLFHGTGVGKTCTAVQVAEEYIMRPEYQDKKVLVVCSKTVESNFRNTLFSMSRVDIDTTAHMLSSHQCTGRRYLDMLLRIEPNADRWADDKTRDRLTGATNDIVNNFYEFKGYMALGTLLENVLKAGTAADREANVALIHQMFDNRMIIIDEAHNIRHGETSLSGKDKAITDGLKAIVKIAKNLVIVFLSATPMYDTYEEVVFYMNLFLWNDQKQALEQEIKTEDYFTEAGDVKPERLQEFRDWCQTYVSFVKGDSPFTFPFRLPPPDSVVAGDDTRPVRDFLNRDIGEKRVHYLTLTQSLLEPGGYQAATIEAMGLEDKESAVNLLPTICALPPGSILKNTQSEPVTFSYKGGVRYFSPDLIKTYATKFATVIDCIKRGTGVVFVYSNYIEQGVNFLGLALEEHGFAPFDGNPMLADYDTLPKVKGAGTYAILKSDTRAEIANILRVQTSVGNTEGKKLRVILAGPIAAEGLDFRYVRQVHILDPWWNNSRIEQAIGRGLRTCSHSALPYEEQNCTVYLHILRGSERETYDEYTYRTKVEAKAVKIAKVRKVIVESAMDCPLFHAINVLPQDWKDLPVKQKRSQDGEEVTLKLGDMMSPAFIDNPDPEQCMVRPSEADPTHRRPLSAFLDVRDEILDDLQALLLRKAIWTKTALLQALQKNRHSEDVAIFNIQHAIKSAFTFKDQFGRASVLEGKREGEHMVYALAPNKVKNQTLVERTSKPNVKSRVPMMMAAPAPQEADAELAPDVVAAPVEEEEEEEEGDTKGKEAPGLKKLRALVTYHEEPGTTPITREEFDVLVNNTFPTNVRAMFSRSTLAGYIFDVKCSAQQKRYIFDHFEEGGWQDLPQAALRVTGRTTFWVRGWKVVESTPGNFLGYVEVHPSVGMSLTDSKDLEAVEAWKAAAKEKFMQAVDSGSYIGTRDLTLPRDGQFKYANYEVIGRRSADLKAYKSHKNRQTVLQTLAEGEALPTGVTEAMFFELLMREGRKSSVWVLPEEYMVLTEPKALSLNKALSDRYKGKK